MLFNKGRRCRKVRQIINLLLLSALAVVMTSALNVFGQEQNKEEPSVPTNEVKEQKTEVDEALKPSNMTTQHLRVTKSAKSLRDYVPRLFPEVSDENIEDALVDNRPSIRFDVIRSNQRFEMLLVSYPKDLVLYGLAREEISTETTDDVEDTKIDLGTTLEVAGCGGLNSAGNPYPCCSNGGNCTWFAWYRSNIVFNTINGGNGFPTANSFGDAKKWATSARNYGYPVSSEAGSRTVGVNSNMSSSGHVFFVEILKWNQLVASEMQCYSYYGPRWSVTYDRSRANLGYIYPKPTSWRPRVSVVVQPTIYAGANPVWILFSGQNFTTDTIVDAVAPNGSTVSLSGSQLSYNSSTSLWMQAVLNMRGYWKFKIVGKDGQRSDWAYVWVN